MTTEATLPSTSASPTARQLWTRARGITLALALLLAGAVTLAALQSDARHGALDPRSADPYGSRALAELLADRGVSTRVVTTLAEARTATSPDTTLLIAGPDLLTEHQQRDLHSAIAGSGGRTVLVAPTGRSVETLAPGVTADPATSRGSALTPGCAFPAARRAGTAETGGIRYTTRHLGADQCYPSARLATLLRVPDASGDGDTVVLGAPDILYNNRLDQQGNASLALQLLGSRSHLVWYLPSLSDTAATDPDDEKGFLDLLPSGWLWGTLQLFLAAALAALWRARRLGPSCPRNSPWRSAPPKPSKAAPASTAKPPPATARPPLCAPPPAPASPLSWASPSPGHTRPRRSSPPCPPTSTATDSPCTPSSSAHPPATTRP